MKSGTDSLWEYLRSHPQVFMSVPKEIDFFVEELNWSKGMSWYESHFARADGARVIGEASTSYSKWPLHEGVPERLASVIPNVRLGYLVRHPIDRIQSQYLHERLLGRERRPIDDAVLSDPSYVNFSRYGQQLREYLKYFDRSQILVLKSEDLREDRRATMARLATFLEIDDSWPDEIITQEFHSTSEKRVLRNIFAFAHRIPGHDAVARRVPDRVREKTLPLRTRGVDTSKFVLGDKVRQLLAETLVDDELELREFLGSNFDCWNIT